MIDHARWHLAARSRLRGTVVAGSPGMFGTSGSAFTRSAGSFVADGWAPGMEVAAAGFPSATHNGVHVVRKVSPASLTVDAVLGSVAEASGRTVQAGIPQNFVLENSSPDDDPSPAPGRPWCTEAWLPGGGPVQRTMGSGGQLEALPSYVVALYVPEATGGLAARRYADAIIRRFPPGYALDVGNGDFCWVRWDLGPFPSPLTPARPGWAVMTITVPFLIRTPNSI